MRPRLSPLFKSTWFSFFISLLIIISVEYYYRSASIDGFWSHKNSDMLMQTLSVGLLKASPIRALWYEHFQPPLFDFSRAVLAYLSDNTGALLIRDVDHGILQLWALCFAGLAATLFAWAKTVSGSLPFSWFVFFLWHLHPSGYAFATFLDATMPSTFLITLFLYEWWKVQFTDPKASELRSSLLLGLLFYLRVTFQFLFFIPHLIAVLLMPEPNKKRKILIFIVPLLICLPLLLKQYLLFDTLYTSTIGSEQKLGLIWVQPADKVSDEISQALARYKYPAGGLKDKYNTEEQVRKNISYGMQFDAFVRSNPWQALLGLTKSIYQNLTQSYFKPSFLHANQNYLMDAFPHIEICTVLLSGAGLIFWLTLALSVWIIRSIQNRTTVRPALIFTISVFYIFFLSIIGNQEDWVEADRYKFFLEPAAFLFVCFEIRQIPELLKVFLKRHVQTTN